MKKLLISILLVLCLFGCSKDSNPTNEGSNTTETTEPTETAEEAYVVYEAIFLDNDEILGIFQAIRGEEPPFENQTVDFHVTTAFMPETALDKWYGTKVNVHISKYSIQEVETDDIGLTSNEGLKVELSSDNEEFNEYLASLNKNFHITGAYKDGAKYTELLDFSKGDNLDIDVVGTFGGFYSDGSFRYESNN